MKNMLKLRRVDKIRDVASLTCHRGARGFTLIEVMVVVVIITILAAIIYPNYQDYVRRSAMAQAQQEMQSIANQLERFKSKNLTYQNFILTDVYTSNPSADVITTPVGGSGAVKYRITLKDLSGTKALNDATATGFGWAMTAESMNDAKNFNLLMTSEGVRCKTKDSVTFSSCTGSEVVEW